MKPTKLIAGAVTLICLSSAAHAQQQVTLLQSPGACHGFSLSTFGGWQSLANGMGCPSGSPTDVLDWAYANGPTPFNGVYFTGYGSFYIELLDGDNVLQGYTFDAWGQDILVKPHVFGSVSRVRITRQSGVGAFGVSGLDGGGGGGGGPAAQAGPPGNGPTGNGPPGIGPNGNGPNGNGPPANEGDLDALVNEPNATPEPATILLVATGLSGVGALARRRRKAEQRQPE